MRIDQLLFGYRDGHRLLASSVELDRSTEWDLVRTTDRPSVPTAHLNLGVTFGYPLTADRYALCRTWTATDVGRPGAVWTHVLLLPVGAEGPAPFAGGLHAPTSPAIGEFSHAIDVRREQDSGRHRLSMEGARLILSVAAQPRSSVQAVSSTDPLELLQEVDHVWPGFLGDRAFATAPGKRITGYEKSTVVIVGRDFAEESFDDYVDLAGPSLTASSSRISSAWRLLGEGPDRLQTWLISAGGGLSRSSGSLKLVVEALLLGKGELDDTKLLARIESGMAGEQPLSLLSYCVGRGLGGVDPPPNWIAALYLLGKDDWGMWSLATTPEAVGRAAADAPIQALAARLERLAHARDPRAALGELAHTIDPDTFREVCRVSIEAAEELVRENPDLLFVLPITERLGRRLAPLIVGTSERGLPWDLELLARAPSIAVPFLASAIRLGRSAKELGDFAVGRLSGGEWRELPPVVRETLIATPGVADQLLVQCPTPAVVEAIYDELGPFAVRDALLRIQHRSRLDLRGLAEALVEVRGASTKLFGPRSAFRDMRPELLAAISEARWRTNRSPSVLERIKREWEDRLEASFEQITDEDLRRALSEVDREEFE